MKLFRQLSLLGLFFYLPLYASESIPSIVTSTTETPTSVDVLITQVKNAPDDQKRVLMNQLKIQLRKMNKESRIKTMKELRKSFSNHKMEQREQQKHNRMEGHPPLNHQPKFRHLQQGVKNNLNRHNGERQGLGLGNRHQGDARP